MILLVVDAVAIEPVSTLKFPTNREKNREFCIIGALGTPDAVNNGGIIRLPMRIPYAAEQGIILLEQGIRTQ
jgi:hypothetical protein